jgi:threonine dehydratase
MTATPADWLGEVEAAAARIAGLVVRTPLVQSADLTQVAGAPVLLKLEFIQPSGSFKLRGAASKMSRLSSKGVKKVVTFSTGNHARAVAWVSSRLSCEATVCVSRRVPEDKVQMLRRLGARVVVSGDSQDEAGDVAHELAADEGLALVHPFDDVDVIAGQGTIGLELLADDPDLDTVLLPLSGGGLAGGVAAAIKAVRPQIRIVAISMSTGAAMAASVRAGHPVNVPESATLADNLNGGIGMDNRYTFGLVRELVDQIELVDEEQIARGMLAALGWERYLIEGAAAVGLAAILAGKVGLTGRTAVVLTGRQVDPAILARLSDRHVAWLRPPGSRSSG